MIIFWNRPEAGFSSFGIILLRCVINVVNHEDGTASMNPEGRDSPSDLGSLAVSPKCSGIASLRAIEGSSPIGRLQFPVAHFIMLLRIIDFSRSNSIIDLLNLSKRGSFGKGYIKGR